MSFKMSKEQLAAYALCTGLQRKFVLHLVQANVSQRTAYYAAGGTAKNDTTADTMASKIFRKVQVKAFYDSLMHEKVSDAIMGRDEAMLILSGIGRASIKDVVDIKEVMVGESEDGEPVYQTVFVGKNGEQISDEAARAISEVTVGSGGTKIKLHSAPGAVKQLAEMEGWNAAHRTEITGKDGGAIVTTDTTDQDIARRVAYMLAKAK